MRKRSTLQALKNGAIYRALIAASALGRKLSLDSARRKGIVRGVIRRSVARLPVCMKLVRDHVDKRLDLADVDMLALAGPAAMLERGQRGNGSKHRRHHVSISERRHMRPAIGPAGKMGEAR